MQVLLSVIGAGLVAAVGAVAWSVSNLPGDPIDPDAEQQWIVRHLLRHPRLAALARLGMHRGEMGVPALLLGFLGLVGAAASVGWILNMVSNGTGLAEGDEALAEWGARNATDTATAIMSVVTELGGTVVVVAAATATAVWDLVRRRGKMRDWQIAWFLIAVTAGQALVNNGLKWLVDRERPDIAQLVGHAGASFPSGHTAAAAATWAAIAWVLGRDRSLPIRRALAAGAACIAAVVAATRVLLGVHWFTDVLAGLAVGWGWFVIVAMAFGGRGHLFGTPAEQPSNSATDRKASS